MTTAFYIILALAFIVTFVFAIGIGMLREQVSELKTKIEDIEYHLINKENNNE